MREGKPKQSNDDNHRNTHTWKLIIGTLKSMRPEFRDGMIRLADDINSRLSNLVAKLQDKLVKDRMCMLLFSTALHDVLVYIKPKCSVMSMHGIRPY